MDDFEREACRRLPLAESSLRLLDYVMADEFLDDLFEQHRGGSYEQVIRFPVIVQLIADSLLEHQGSGQRSFSRAKENGTLTASTRAVYGKLARLPLELSRGFLTASTQRLQEVFPAVAANALPRSLAGFRIVALDGKKIKHVAKRLKALRKTKGQVLGGKLVVALDLGTGLVLALEADADGEVSDAPLVPGVLRQVRAAGQLCLYVSDRQFCDLNQTQLQGQNGDQWLIRYNAKVSFHPDPSRPSRVGTDAQGRSYVEEWGWLGVATHPQRCYVRRLTLQRPGEEAISLVTSLLDADLYPAEDLLEVYRQRWGIESVFQKVTEVYHLKALIGSTPQATVFQAAFCFLLYNLIVVLRAYLSEAQAQPPEQISSENLFDDVQRQLIAWQEVIGPEPTAEVLGPSLTAKGLRRKLKGLLSGVWSGRWLKAPPKKSPSKHPDKKEYLKGGHNSVYRLLQDAKKTKQKKDIHSRK